MSVYVYVCTHTHKIKPIPASFLKLRMGGEAITI